MDISTIVDKLIAPLRRRVRLMVSRAILSAVSDGAGIQLVQVKLLDGEVRDGVERFQDYGFTSVPVPGAEGVMVCVSGDRDHGIVIKIDDRRARMKGLQPADVAVYDNRGQFIHLHQDGILAYTPGVFRVDAQHIEFHARGTYRFDANGQGQRWDGQGVETWQDNDVARPHHNHQPPEIG